MLKPGRILVLVFVPLFAHGQLAVVDVGVTPTGSFQIKSTEVRGFAERKGDTISAKNIAVGLKNLNTGIPLRDTHTKKYLEVEKFPDAVMTTGLGRGGKGLANLQIKGIVQKVKGTYEVKGDSLVAKFPLKLSDYKINDVKYLGVGVDDDVNLTVTVPIKPAAPERAAASTPHR